uniref:Inositol monophosphatase n=1 Tax=uncultured Helicobacter sp. TaxID=175537 RepID=A0A650EKP8_9HELI|nr:inositol monophosphatase [uncultured Helicobacter sp.]
MSVFVKNASLATQKIIHTLKNMTPDLYVYHQKGAGGDVSIGADLVSEKIYMDFLLPLAHIDSEESGRIPSPSQTQDTIILDPLDGSDNFLSHIPYYGSSLALCDEMGNVKESVVFNFCTGEGIARIHQSKKCFRFCIDEILKGDFAANLLALQQKDHFSESVLGNVKCGIFEKAYANPHFAHLLYENKIKFRSLGASALSIANAHRANFMLFLGNIRAFDSKAGIFLCEDLHHKHTADYLLISRDKHIFDMIHQLLLKEQYGLGKFF